ncbi:Cytochrome P450 [Penicillium paradoxum]|uniref:Cytochrome P450 n=1 Tax=Penicillium paradoxum TaxID=176176 RepID=UPI002549044E|nr:Cytochrome P450 [Penicillium paradoxum]KAJ5793682.1 Cytochrome P450 [Penicillium paradoxum]
MESSVNLKKWSTVSKIYQSDGRLKTARSYLDGCYLYSINKGYQKTNFYCVQQQLVKGRPTPTLFTTTDENFHAAIKRPVSSAYSMSTLIEFEPFVDRTIQTFFEKLDTFVVTKKVCDIATWLQYYAFDVIGELTFSKPLGFLEKGADVDGIIVALERMLDYFGKIGQMPWLDYVFIKNPLKGLFRGGSRGAIARFARARVDERLKEMNISTSNSRQKDFLTRFLEAKTEHPNVVDDNQVFSYTVSNMNAGSDTTAISLRAILYYILKHPLVHAKLNTELNLALEERQISLPVSWKQSQEQLPYLDAVIKEALRLHPAVGLMLERVDPADGLQLPGGPFLPAGTIVGVNPWIIHRHPAFGEDVESFVPERWLKMGDESESEFYVRKQKMNISLLEIYKLIPTLFLNYEIELNDPSAERNLVNAWFVRQKHMDVKLAHISGMSLRR